MGTSILVSEITGMVSPGFAIVDVSAGGKKSGYSCFNHLEFEMFKSEAGSNYFVLSPKRWIESRQRGSYTISFIQPVENRLSQGTG